eukprot:m.1085001 g.1085001  ORF g.1085001 m.1085001 type:complete len:109 (+) comp24277_c0_seq3:2212-2538(+)
MFGKHTCFSHPSFAQTVVCHTPLFCGLLRRRAGTYGGGAATDASATEPVHLSSCAATDVWRYEEATKHIVHVRTNKCMDSLGDALVVAVCDPAGRAEQQWTFSGHLNC